VITNTATGIISGQVAANGSYHVTISATNAGGTGSAVLLVTVSAAPTTTTTTAAAA
jgi:hypothetical protein